jgi:hypothetical protein
MRHGLAATALLFVVFVGQAIRAAPIDDLRPPIVTRQAVFSIPFTVPPTGPNQQPAEVRLLASGDVGKTWQQIDRVDVRSQRLPYKGAFTFRAPADGEFWFAIRTVNHLGQMVGDKIGAPELRVVVDTRPPRLDLAATRGTAGEVVVRWQIVDPNLKPESLKIEYQSAADPRWQAVAFDRSRADAARTTMSSEAIWWPTDARGVVAFKAEVADLAGNTVVAQAQVDLLQHGQPLQPENGDRAPLTASMNRKSRFDEDSPRNRDEERIEGPAFGPPTSRSIESPVHPPVGSQFVPPERVSNSPTYVDRGDRTINRESTMPSATRETPTVARGTFDFKVPPGEKLRMVNSQTFELDYEVDSVGRSGIAKTELWMTRDGGRSWTSMGVDGDNRSPFVANVDREGVYGYRMTVQSGSGLGGRPPQSGDPPEVWLGVDLTRPQAKLLSAETGTGDRAGEIIIRYQADDAMLAERPVTLLQSTQPSGPWSTIASGLDNTGQYSWRFDSGVPDRVYLRLEVRDEAGNVGAFDAADPVSLERVLPRARLRGARPIGQQ